MDVVRGNSKKLLGPSREMQSPGDARTDSFKQRRTSETQPTRPTRTTMSEIHPTRPTTAAGHSSTHDRTCARLFPPLQLGWCRSQSAGRTRSQSAGRSSPKKTAGRTRKFQSHYSNSKTAGRTGDALPGDALSRPRRNTMSHRNAESPTRPTTGLTGRTHPTFPREDLSKCTQTNQYKKQLQGV